MVSFKMGEMTVSEICEILRFELALTSLLPSADHRVLQPHRHWLEPDFLHDGNIRLMIRSWLLQRNNRNILVDACVGNHKSRPSRKEWHLRDEASWLGALAAHGLQPEDIDVVFCTHLHADHVGWNTRLYNGNWVPTFPNARYITSSTEYVHWEAQNAIDEIPSGHGSFIDSVLPIMDAGQMELISDGYELAKGLVLQSSPGHTPGHMSIDVNCEGDKGVFCGDVLHSPVQIIQPEWSSAFCTSPDLARKTRVELLERLCDTSHWLIPMHFSGAGRCRVLPHKNAFLPEFAASNNRD